MHLERKPFENTFHSRAPSTKADGPRSGIGRAPDS